MSFMKIVRNEVKYYIYLHFEKCKNISSQRILIEIFPTPPPPPPPPPPLPIN